jgi:hypothetical protein
MGIKFDFVIETLARTYAARKAPYCPYILRPFALPQVSNSADFVEKSPFSDDFL